MTGGARKANKMYFEILEGERDFEVIYRIPASEDYPWGDEVGWIKSDGWLFSVSWSGGKMCDGYYSIPPDEKAPFPASTKWMITNNDAINYGLTQ